MEEIRERGRRRRGYQRRGGAALVAGKRGGAERENNTGGKGSGERVIREKCVRVREIREKER